MAMPTLLDIAKANAADQVVGLIDEAARAKPEVTMGAARTIPGTQYKTLVRTALPTMAFRNANEGTAVQKGTFENRLIETFILNPQFEVDKAVADAFIDGWEAYLALEADAQVEAALQHLAKVFYYGTDATFGDVKGFPGMIQSYDATNMVVDAGGTTGDTASSLWAVKFGPKDVQWIYGQNGELSSPDVTVVRLIDDSSNPYTGYRSELTAYPGVQVGKTKSIGRIKKLTEDANKGLTDALIHALLAKFVVGGEPDVLFATKRSIEQLRSSRTATNATGAPAPYPTEVQGIPLVPTEAISNIESLTL